MEGGPPLPAGSAPLGKNHFFDGRRAVALPPLCREGAHTWNARLQNTSCGHDRASERSLVVATLVVLIVVVVVIGIVNHGLFGKRR